MKIAQNLLFVCLLASVISACTMKYTPPVLAKGFDETPIPAAPDYSRPEHWAALPGKEDMADLIPKKLNIPENQNQAKADVFFIHPTTYTYAPDGTYLWNGSLDDEKLNKRTDESSIKNQASIFNAAGRVYAPRYRQAHIHSFFTSVKEDGQRALDIAYQDVKTAFLFYIENENKGRPFILASHSQGTLHAGRLIKELIENTPLEKKLISAYLVGIPVPKDYTTLRVCDSPDDINCYVSWNTFADGYYPPDYKQRGYENANCINPLTWNSRETQASRKNNKGGVVWNYKVIPEINDARVVDGMLWIKKPHIPGRMFYKVKNYHIGDYNLFYVNIRENAIRRTKHYFEKEDKAEH
ncbi:MAG: DUF3089 domain-containing protein [Flavobacteriales bacterium]